MSTPLPSPLVVLVRHAESEWNRAGRFTGWADPPLTERGRAEATDARTRLAKHGFTFDRIYSSRLTQARETAELVLANSNNRNMPIVADWRLNERHYGALQGMDKASMAQHVGEDQVWRWRRGYLDRPPALAGDDPRHPRRDSRWSDIDRAQLPNGETLAATRERVIDFWRNQVEPQVRTGQRLLISSHGNTLRALLMALDRMSIEQVESFEIPTGLPIVCAFTLGGEPLGWQFLGEKVAAA